MPHNPHGEDPRDRLRVILAPLVLCVTLVAGASTTAAQPHSEGRTQAVVTVLGMQCPFCAYGIRKHLTKVPGVTRVDVELAKNHAVVSVAPDADVTDAHIQRAIRRAGFTPGTIEWRPAGRREGTKGSQAPEDQPTSEPPPGASRG